MSQLIKLRSHCQNPNCSNFTSNYDLSGIWCQDVCFIEFETGQRISYVELLEMKVDYDWDLDEFEKADIEKYGIVKSPERISKD